MQSPLLAITCSHWECAVPLRRIAEKLLKSEMGDRVAAPAGTYSLFMTAWINLQIHDWFFHNVTDDDPWTLQACCSACVRSRCWPFVVTTPRSNCKGRLPITWPDHFCCVRS